MPQNKEQKASTLAALTVNPLDSRHGSTYGYSIGCRCVACKQAASRANQERRARGLPNTDHRHGTYTGYSAYGCRCPRCVDAGHRHTVSYKDTARSRRLMKNYGLSVDDWERLWAEQRGRCFVCSIRLTRAADTNMRGRYVPRLTDAVVDHEHRTGLPNRLLCGRCNLVLGKTDNDSALLVALAHYADTYHSADYFEDRAATTTAVDSTA